MHVSSNRYHHMYFAAILIFETFTFILFNRASHRIASHQHSTLHLKQVLRHGTMAVFENHTKMSHFVLKIVWWQAYVSWRLFALE